MKTKDLEVFALQTQPSQAMREVWASTIKRMKNDGENLDSDRTNQEKDDCAQ